MGQATYLSPIRAIFRGQAVASIEATYDVARIIEHRVLSMVDNGK